MTSARRDYFLSLSPAQAARVRRDARAAIRLAWNGRHNQPRRASIVISANVATLRDLAASV